MYTFFLECVIIHLAKIRERYIQMTDLLAGLYEPSMNIYNILGIFIAICGITTIPYSIIGFFTTRKFKVAKNQHKYAVLIAARNEESVIANLIESIHKQDYPKELITTFVVADNCTDKTAQIARQCGAICYERFDDHNKTKGFALQFLFEQIEKDYGIDSFEGYFIFDADNLLKEDYISRMNDSFDAGEKIITSYRATKNFNESWIASTYALHWLSSIRTRHRARSVLRLATNIQGTGFLFSNEIVRNGWKYTSLTEDRALTADCVVQGYEISYNNDAIFYDEQPVDLKIAFRQRIRWAKGHLLAFAESGPGLFKNIFIDKTTKPIANEKWYHTAFRSIRHRFMSFDTFCQLCPKHIINIAKWIVCKLVLYPFVCYKLGMDTIGLFYNSTILGKALTAIFGDIIIQLPPGLHTYFMCLGVVVWFNLWRRICSYIQNIFGAVYIFFIERKRIIKISLFKKILYCLTWPTFAIIGRYAQYLALFMKVTWKPIPHNSKINIDDISQSSK